LKALALGAAAAAAAAPTAFGEPPMKRKPNIIFILGDDLGWAELGCYGNKFNETPHLDALAARSVRFTDAYAAAPVCSPYRAALMTGQVPARVGITDYLRPNDAKYLSTSHVTIAKLLKRAGYATGIIGKWHLTGYAADKAKKEVPPSEHGFDETIISEDTGIGGGSYFHPYHFNKSVPRRLEDPEYLVDRMNVEAVDFIQRHKDEPFFLYLSHYAVHTRLLGKPDLVAKYEAKPAAGKGPRAARNNPHLAAQLESIDAGVGMIVDKLKQLGIADDTVLVFTGDNGGETNVTTNAPWRGGKSMLYEGGVREPLIVYWPGVTPAGKVCKTPTMNIDFYPTFAEMAGAKLDPAQQLDGLSIAPLLKDPASKLPRDTFCWHYPLARRHFLGGRSAGAIRQGDWKLIEFFDTGQVELYDLSADAGESKDLAGQSPDKARQLRDALAAWRKCVGATIPADCRDYDPHARK
jgi:arylsulfatase A-like enzyme